MASVFVKACLDTARQFNGSGVTAIIDGKKSNAFFKVYCDDTDVEEAVSLARKDANIVMLEYQGVLDALSNVDIKGVYICVVRRFGDDITMSDIEYFMEEVPEGVYCVCKLPQGYCNMAFIQEVSEKYNRVRFCGGTFFALRDCHLGCCGQDIVGDKVKSKGDNLLYEGCACCLDTYSEEDVELVEGKVKSTKKRTLNFQDLLYANGRVEF